MRVPGQKFFVPANLFVAGTKNFCPGTRMARSYTDKIIVVSNAHWNNQS